MIANAVCCDCGEVFLRYDNEVWKVRCLSCWAIAKARRESRTVRQPPPPDPVLAELRDNLRGLLSLCHPDRHGNSALSTNITRWLLAVRERLAKETTQ